MSTVEQNHYSPFLFLLFLSTSAPPPTSFLFPFPPLSFLFVSPLTALSFSKYTLLLRTLSTQVKSLINSSTFACSSCRARYSGIQERASTRRNTPFDPPFRRWDHSVGESGSAPTGGTKVRMGSHFNFREGGWRELYQARSSSMKSETGWIALGML
jgi:hypothetical protein